MGRNVGIRNLLMLLLFLIVTISSLRPTFSQTTRPICYTQISAANQACSILSPRMVSEVEVSVVTNEKHHKVRDDDDGDGHDGDHEHDDDGDHGADDGGDGHDGDDDDHDGDHDDDNHGHDHDDDDHGHNRRGRKHRKDDDKFRHVESSANKECCKWLQEVDNDCVCESLLRLPPFLVKPKHKYTIKVGRSCKLTFDCPGIIHLPRVD